MIVPLMIWSARTRDRQPGVERRDEHAARTPRRAPIEQGRRDPEDGPPGRRAQRPAGRTPTHQPVKALASIMPSMPMFTTPGALAQDAAQGAEGDRRRGPRMIGAMSG